MRQSKSPSRGTHDCVDVAVVVIVDSALQVHDADNNVEVQQRSQAIITRRLYFEPHRKGRQADKPTNRTLTTTATKRTAKKEKSSQPGLQELNYEIVNICLLSLFMYEKIIILGPGCAVRCYAVHLRLTRWPQMSASPSSSLVYLIILIIFFLLLPSPRHHRCCLIFLQKLCRSLPAATYPCTVRRCASTSCRCWCLWNSLWLSIA